MLSPYFSLVLSFQLFPVKKDKLQKASDITPRNNESWSLKVIDWTTQLMEFLLRIC